MSTVKSLYDSEEKFNCYILLTNTDLERQIELSHTQEEIHHSKNSTITPIKPWRECKSRIIFEQGIHLPESHRDS